MVSRQTKPTAERGGTTPHAIVSFDDEAIKGYVGKLVAKTVEETLNELLDEEAAQLVNAGRYE